MPDLLIEIGTEEIPAAQFAPALRAAAESVAASLAFGRIRHGEITALGTHRRLAVHVADLAEDSGEFETIVALSIPAAIDAVPRPVPVRWPQSEVPFVAPIRNLVALLGDRVVAVTVAGVDAGRSTVGHAILAPDRFELETADLSAYRDRLRDAKVVVDPAEREAGVRSELAARLGEDRTVEVGSEVQFEVVSKCEWPRVIEGSTEAAGTDLPVEVLDVVMRRRIGLVPSFPDDGRSRPRFLKIIDREGDPEGSIRAGYERALRGCLADVRYLLAKDRPSSLAACVGRLADRPFHLELGSCSRKMDRLVELSTWLAARMDVSDPAQHVPRAALLAKADLVTEVVERFPELHGTIGRIYALRDGEGREVADAIEDHLRPRGPADRLPRGPVSTVLAIAEKLDNLAAFFSIGGAPAGPSDRFGLRDEAAGLLRILVEGEHHLSIGRAVHHAVDLVGADDPQELAETLVAFLRDRLARIVTDSGCPVGMVRACLAVGSDDVLDFRRRLDAISSIVSEVWWPDLVDVVEKTGSILRGVAVATTVDRQALVEPAEKDLHHAVTEHGDRIRELLSEFRYAEAAKAFTEAIVSPARRFLDEVGVATEDPAARGNRRALLGRVNDLFGASVADLSQVKAAAT
jgi:glycyl-tRNA synthetase beta chain